MPKKKKETRGGARKGAGQFSKYDEPTVLINFRIPLSLRDDLKRVYPTGLAALFIEWARSIVIQDAEFEE